MTELTGWFLDGIGGRSDCLIVVFEWSYLLVDRIRQPRSLASARAAPGMRKEWYTLAAGPWEMWQAPEPSELSVCVTFFNRPHNNKKHHWVF